MVILVLRSVQNLYHPRNLCRHIVTSLFRRSLQAYGGIAGYLNGSLQNCLVLGANISGTNYVGAVVGMKSDNHTYTANYYRGCTVNGSTNSLPKLSMPFFPTMV